MGIPCLRVRVAQMVAEIAVVSIFESNLRPEPYAYRAVRWTLSGTRIGC